MNHISSAEGVSRYWGKIANQIVYFSCDLSTKNYYALSTNSHFSREKEDIDLLWISIFVIDFFKKSTETTFTLNNFCGGLLFTCNVVTGLPKFAMFKQYGWSTTRYNVNMTIRKPLGKKTLLNFHVKLFLLLHLHVCGCLILQIEKWRL